MLYFFKFESNGFFFLQFGVFLLYGDPPPPLLKKSHFHFVVQIVAQCSETNEKLIYHFLFYDFFFRLLGFFAINLN